MIEALQVTPNVFPMASFETLPLTFNTAARLLVGEAPTDATATLVDKRSNASYSNGLSGSASINGNIITQTVTNLQAGHRYWLFVSFTAAVGKRWTGVLEIVCPF